MRNSDKPTKKLWAAAVAVFLFVTIIIAAQNMEKPDLTSVKEYSGTPTQWIHLWVNECDIWIDAFSNDIVYDVVTLNSEVPNKIRIDSFKGYEITINGVPLLSENDILLNLNKLSTENRIKLEFKDTSSGVIRHSYINTMPQNYTAHPILRDNPDPGFYYYNLANYACKMNTEGELVYWRYAGKGDIVSGGVDFKRTEVDGKVYYSYLFGNESDASPFLTDVGYGRMQALVMNESYEVIDVVSTLLPYDDISDNVSLENHQFTVIGDNHYILSAYVGKRSNNFTENVKYSKQGARVVACILQEIKDEEVVFHWDSTRYPELYDISVEDNDYYNATAYWSDYAHFNAVAIDPKDGNWVCSFRNLDTILKIDRKTGEIIWKLGGKQDEFGLTDKQKFSRQHDVRFTSDGSITLFNNGNVEGSVKNGQTSIMKFMLDEEKKNVIAFNNYQVEGDFSPFMGSAQELDDGKYVIGWGYRTSTNALFSEIDYKNRKVNFEYIYPSNGGQNSVYRVYKFKN